MTLEYDEVIAIVIGQIVGTITFTMFYDKLLKVLMTFWVIFRFLYSINFIYYIIYSILKHFAPQRYQRKIVMHTKCTQKDAPMDTLTVPVIIRAWFMPHDFTNKLGFDPDVRNWTFFACSITSFLVLRNSVSEAHVVCLEIVEIMLFTISSSYNGEFEIDSF